jgi:hypothetical protein
LPQQVNNLKIIEGQLNLLQAAEDLIDPPNVHVYRPPLTLS